MQQENRVYSGFCLFVSMKEKTSQVVSKVLEMRIHLQ